MQPMNTSTPDDYDSPWKDMLETYFEPFLAFFFPHVHAEIAWARGYTFLDKELRQVVRDAALGRRLVDKLVKVWRIDGTEAWVLIHIEVQGQEESDFGQRMYVYHYRIYDRYQRPVVSLAVLADERRGWRPNKFAMGLWGCTTQFRFPVVKLLDYRKKWSMLEASRNPFATVVMAHLKTQETRHKAEERGQWKFSLLRRLYEQGYSREDIINLFHFIDWIMQLPEALEDRFWQELQSYEEAQHMPYVSPFEQRTVRRTKADMVLRLLTRRCGILDEATTARIRSLTLPQLDALFDAALDFTTSADLSTWLKPVADNQPPVASPNGG